MPPVCLGRLRLPATVLAAAGSMGFAAGQAGRPATTGDRPQLGAIVTRGLAWRTRRGHAPQIVETAAGAVYYPGSAQLGVAGALKRHARAWTLSPSPIIVNLQAGVATEFAAAAAELEGVAGVSALELNLATTNDATGLAFAHHPTIARQVIAGVRRACAYPILVKLPADTPDLAATLAACAVAEADAATLATGLPVAGGYLVGPATFPILLALVTRIIPHTPLPIIAAGGVTSASQAAHYLRAGAAAVQVGSACLANPLAAYDVLEGLGG